MQLARSLIAATVLALLWPGASSHGASTCNEAVAFRQPLEHGSATVTWLNGLALKFRSPLAINTDGAPNAYHIDGRPIGALNTLCNAGRSISQTYGIYEGSENCDQFLMDVKAAQRSGWHGSTQIVWHGIVTKDPTRREPVVQSTGDYAGFFVSATSLANREFKADDQRRYLDSRVVPFLVLPRSSAFQSQGGARLGDLAFVIDPETQRYTFAVVGDIGPKRKLGEASIALAATIKGKQIDPKALTGKEVRQLVVPQKVVTLLFPGTSVEPPYDAGQIAAAAFSAIERFGDFDLLRQCASQQ